MIANLFKIYLLVSECTVQVTHLKQKSKQLCPRRVYIPECTQSRQHTMCNPLDRQQTVENLTGSSQLQYLSSFISRNGWHQNTKKQTNKKQSKNYT